jgi:hypothetical protein
MRIKAIQLSWFRGAAVKDSLKLGCKSMVVYGENGSGKSSFVDAVEYVLNGGKIKHLAHEYSGKRQEKAIPNTHMPEGEKTALSIKFKDDSELLVEIKPDGSSKSSGAEAIAMGTWDYQRTVLRQDELAAFICHTKGEKYSALLPLLGLQPMEVAAENLRQLAKSIEQQPKITEVKAALRQVETKRKATFGADSDEDILKKIEGLHSQYCAGEVAVADALSHCNALEAAINTRILLSSGDQRRYIALQSAAELDVKGHLEAVRKASMKLADAVEPLIAEKLEVLQSTTAFVTKLADQEEVKCPSCGRSIPVDVFKAHVDAERKSLQEILQTFNTRKANLATLSDSVKSLKSSLGMADAKPWRDELSKGAFSDNLAYLDEIDAEALRATCTEEQLKAIQGKLLPLVEAAAAASQSVPPDVQQLSADKLTVEIGKAAIQAKEQAAAASRADSLLSFISSLEQGVREEIRERCQTVMDEISADIQAMWSILHPGEPIKDVHLYVPKDEDKAIDIGLKFHDVKQDSPRLTLSEGYRNSLGLCIFLAMAKREGDKDRPLFLDDVVVSLDRNHRGMIAEVLEKDFSKRQVVILTHDREWYTELHHQIDGKKWDFGALLPYETPSIGIRWSHKATTFGDARAYLKEHPASAGNDARKIMDVELALIAERLRIRLPYLRAEKNDHRMAHDFLERLVADGKKCFQMKLDEDYVCCSDAIDALEKADCLLVSWANRASHSFDLVRSEADKLIDACEKALLFFECSSCGKNTWFSDAGGPEFVQCQCGKIRWRYGKG